MKSILRNSAFILAAVVLFAVPARAQSYTISNTTLSGSINATQTTMVLTSASASSGSTFGDPAAGQCLFIDGELMRIVSMSSTTATVTRQPYTPASHPSGAVIWTAACSAFKQTDPPVNTFSTTAANNTNNSCSTFPAPWINASSGNIWWCNRNNNRLTGTNFAVLAYNSVPTGQ